MSGLLGEESHFRCCKPGQEPTAQEFMALMGTTRSEQTEPFTDEDTHF